MFRRIVFLVVLFVSFCQSARTQTGTVVGVISDNDGNVEFVNVGIPKLGIGTITDSEGAFELKDIPFGKHSIQISSVGYITVRITVQIKSDSPIKITKKLLDATEDLEEVVVTGTMKAVSKRESAVPIEVYSPTYFRQNPTPSLFAALQSINGVRPQLNCSVCNTGDIHVNGMEGPYTMVVIDGMPIVGGLSSVYGLSGIPNSLIDQLEVVKGPASTLYGSEAVGGLINVITKNPTDAPLFAVDITANTWQEINTDLGMKYKLGKVNGILGVNYFNYTNPIDKNGDGFTDLTIQNRVSVFNKLALKRKEDRIASLAIRYVNEERWGGQMDFAPKHRLGTDVYGESIYTDRWEFIGKYQLPTKPTIVWSSSYSIHDQNSAYGTVSYLANQQIGFSQITWEPKKMVRHDWLVGAAYRYNFYDDNTPATTNAKDSSVNDPSVTHLVGVFVQDEIKISVKTILLTGLRYDYYEEHGNIFSPRLNMKMKFNEDNILRLSAGNGFRVVNLFAEEHAALTGAREVIVKEELKPETSYNVNLNFERHTYPDFGLFEVDASVFYTYFTNKITPDYETDDDLIIYENLDGHAVSSGVTLNAKWVFQNSLRVRTGITLMDVYQKERNVHGELENVDVLLTEKYSGVFAIGYTVKKIKLKIDYTGNFYGPMKLPLLENDFRDGESPLFSIQNIQLTKEIKKNIEIYGGVKNILNYTPPSNSIMRSFDPFDKEAGNTQENPNGYTFDPTYVYTSFQGIRGFIGARWTLD